MSEEALDSSLIDQSVESFDQRVEYIKEYGYEFNLLAYINKGFSVFGKFAGGFIGYLFVFWGLLCASMLLALIPVVGAFVMQFIVVCLFAGFYIVAQKISTDLPYSFSSFFGGFEYFKNLTIKTLLFFAVVLIMVVPLVALSFLYGTNIQSFYNVGSGFSGSFAMTIVPAFLLLVCLFIYLLWIFSDFNILFARQTPWKAMEMSRKVVSKKLGWFFLFGLAILVLNILGCVLLVVGLLVTIPVSFIALYCAWEDIMITQANPPAAY